MKTSTAPGRPPRSTPTSLQRTPHGTRQSKKEQQRSMLMNLVTKREAASRHLTAGNQLQHAQILSTATMATVAAGGGQQHTRIASTAKLAMATVGLRVCRCRRQGSLAPSMPVHHWSTASPRVGMVRVGGLRNTAAPGRTGPANRTPRRRCHRRCRP